MGKLFDSSGNRIGGTPTTNNQTKTPAKNESLTGVALELAKNFPTLLARTLVTPGEFMAQAGKTVGEMIPPSKTVGKIAQKVTGIKTPQQVQKLKQDIEGKGFTLPYQTEQLYKPITSFKSVGEAAGKGLEAATDIAMNLVGGGGAKTLAKEGVKLVLQKGGKEVVKNLAKDTAKVMLKDFGIGSAYGLATTLQEEGATAKDYVTNIGMGGVLAASFPLVAGAATKVLGRGTSLMSKAVGETLERTATKLEKKFSPQKIEKDAVRYYQKAVEEAPKVSAKIGLAAADAIRKLKESPKRLSTLFLDKYTAVKTLADKAQAAGVKVKDDLLEKVQGTRYRGLGKAENKLDDYLAIKKSYGEDWNQVKELSHYMDKLDRIANGNLVTDGKTLKDVNEALTKFYSDIGPEKSKVVIEGQKKLQAFLNQELQDAVDSGRLSKEGYANIKKAHPNYIPHNVLDFLEEGYSTAGVGASLNVAKSGIEKAKGSTREIADIDEAVVDRLVRQNVLNEKNKTIKTIIDVGKELPDTPFTQMKEPIKEVDYKKEGLEKISYFNNGVKEDWLVPEDLGRALKNIDSNSAGFISQWLSGTTLGKIVTTPARIIRTVSTVKNPVFAMFSNPIRDMQTAKVIADYSLKDYADGLISAITRGKKDNELYRLARESGALQGSVFRENLSPDQILQQKLSSQGILGKVSNAVTFNWVNSLGESFEEATRLAVFKDSLRKGLRPEEAAKIARNATVDFGKSGTVTEAANKVVPFLNARIQGFTNLINAFKTDPVNAYRKLMWTSLYPATILYAHNQRYSSYQNIPDSDKRKYWIIMTGQTEGKDYQNKKIMVPHYIKIAKGEAQQAASNVAERVLNYGKDKYPVSTQKFIQNLITDTSPILESSIFPPGASQYYELKANYSYYRQQQIEPDWIYIGKKAYKTSELEPGLRFTANTSEIAKQLGAALNWSPIKIDYVIKTGLINDLIRLYDLPFKGFKAEAGKVFERAAELPFVRSILGTSFYGAGEKEKAFEQQKTMEKTSEKAKKAIERQKTQSQQQ